MCLRLGPPFIDRMTITLSHVLICPNSSFSTLSLVLQNVKADASRLGISSGESSEPPMPSRPPPPPPPPRVATGTPPPLPARPSPGHVSITKSRNLPPRPAAAKGNFWLAKAGLTRKKREGVSPASSPPITPPRVFDAGDSRGIRNATGAWAKLRQR